MGLFGPGLFDNDLVADIRGKYRTFVEQGLDDAEALRRILKHYKKLFVRDDWTGLLVGFAVAQSELGRLDPAIRDQAIAAIDRGGDLAIWRQDRPRSVERRRAVLAEARAKLSGPQPERVLLQPLEIRRCDLVVGDVLALDSKSGLAIFRVRGVTAVAPSEVPVLEQLEYAGSDEPSLKVLEGLRAREVPTKSGRILFREEIMVKGDPSAWKELGFRKIGQVGERKAGSHRSAACRGRVVSWSQLLSEHR